MWPGKVRDMKQIIDCRELGGRREEKCCSIVPEFGAMDPCGEWMDSEECCVVL